MVYRDTETHALLIAAFSGRVFGIDRMTGARRWEFEGREAGGTLSETVAGASGRAMAPIVRVLVFGGRVYAFFGNELCCLEYANGKLIWRVPTIGLARGAALLHDEERLFIAGHGALACFNRDGDLLWRDEFHGKGHGKMALALPGFAAQADV